MKFLNILLLSASAALLTLAASAQAATDTKDYAGSMCVAMDAGDHTLFMNAQGGLSNGSTSKGVHVLCPLPRDLKRISSVQVRLFVIPNSSILCVLRTIRSNQTIQAQQVLFTAFAAPALTQLNFASQPAPSTGTGIYTLECDLPKADLFVGEPGIAMYWVTESD